MKSFLGGTLHPKEDQGNGVPGPGNYDGRKNYTVPGFKIMQPLEDEEKKQKKIKKERFVGP